MNKFWTFKGLADKKGELFLYGEISDSSWFGDEVTPAQFQKDLVGLGQIDALDVFINSPGGDVFAGISIYHILKRHEASITVHVDGIAASAASIVAMAGDRIVMPKAATLMIHNAWSFGAGNKTKMRAMADELERLDGQLADIYASRTGKDAATVSVWMDQERWMSGDEALKDGFCDEVEENAQIAACADADKFFARYKNPPKARAEPEMVQPGHTHTLPQYTHMTGITPAAPPADNGAVTPQPVADKSPETAPAGAPDALAEQRNRFRALRLKLLEE